jgi:hypothetical protein
MIAQPPAARDCSVATNVASIGMEECKFLTVLH